MPKLSSLYSKPEKIVEPVEGDDDLILYVKREKITPKFLRELESLEKSESKAEQIDALIKYLLIVLDSWNLTDDKKKSVPLTSESLEGMGLEGLMFLWGIATRQKETDPNAESSPE